MTASCIGIEPVDIAWNGSVKIWHDAVLINAYIHCVLRGWILLPLLLLLLLQVLCLWVIAICLNLF